VSAMRSGNNSIIDGTTRWRLLWWSDVIDYTIFGSHFWTGKGFGLNIAVDDGYRTEEKGTRSPHNVHMTILARMGVPGAALWLLFLTTFATQMLITYVRARRNGNALYASLSLWVIAFWVAFVVNGTFDVFLEGPQGGIWFWSLTGFGVAVAILFKRETPSSRIAAAASPSRYPRESRWAP
jgi:O-antigen ligase